MGQNQVNSGLTALEFWIVPCVKPCSFETYAEQPNEGGRMCTKYKVSIYRRDWDSSKLDAYANYFYFICPWERLDEIGYNSPTA